MGPKTAAKLKPGEQVQLHSRGQVMTVLDVGRDTGMIFCCWSDGGGTCERAFPAGVLTKEIVWPHGDDIKNWIDPAGAEAVETEDD